VTDALDWAEEGGINFEVPYSKINGKSSDAYVVSCSSIPKMRIESWWERQKNGVRLHTALTHSETMVQHLRFTRGDMKAKFN
jgi:hypothetical protein